MPISGEVGLRRLPNRRDAAGHINLNEAVKLYEQYTGRVSSVDGTAKDPGCGGGL
ncbi:hypothetical protein GCM10027405_31780 [Arthrobacter alkaliphilus]